MSEADSLPFKAVLSGITYPDSDYRIYRKCSDVYVIEYISEGEGTVVFEGKEYKIEKGGAYILPAGAEHCYYSDKNNPWEKKWMNVSGSLCERLLGAYGIGKTVYFPDMPIGDLFDEFFDFCTKNSDDNEINNFGALIFHRMVQRLVKNGEKDAENAAVKAKSYIDSNIYGKLSAASVAQIFGFSVSQFGRIFKAEYGKTVYSYILEQKIKTAENLLKNSALTVKEIADMLCFNDEHYFCNIFKKKRGTTPSEYRR